MTRPPFVVERGGAHLTDRGRYGSADVSLTAPAGRRIDGLSYGYASMGAVMSGAFDYRAGKGAVEAVPGIILCGDSAEQFSFTSRGDGVVRRAVIAFDVGMIEETAEAVGSAPRFPGAFVGCCRKRARLYGLLRGLASTDRPQEELALRALGLALSDDEGALAEVPLAAAGRLREVAKHLSETCAEPWELAGMAALAGMSRYHFIRSFAAVIGETPRQHLIHARLRLAADQLIDTREPVTSIALTVGFNDISHFNHAFRRLFDASPTRWLSGFSLARR